MKIIYLSFCLLAAFSLNAANARAQGNLILNGSFEANNGSFTNWTIRPVPESGYVAINASYYVLPAADGTYFAGFLYNGGTISQTITTMSGYYYALNLSAIESAGTNRVSVNVNGSLLANLNFPTSQSPLNDSSTTYVFNTNWVDFNYVFQASSNLTTLAFTYYPQIITDNDNDYYYGLGGLDAISVMAVPEPKTVILLVGCFVGWLACGRYKRLKQDKKIIL
jgi:hypothetical protein